MLIPSKGTPYYAIPQMSPLYGTISAEFGRMGEQIFQNLFPQQWQPQGQLCP